MKREEIRQGPFRNRSFFHRIFSTVGLNGLIYAFYHCNENKIIGSVLVFSLTMLEFICAIEAWVTLFNIHILNASLTILDIILIKLFQKSKRETDQENNPDVRSSVRIFVEASDGFLDFYWIVIGGFYGLVFYQILINIQVCYTRDGKVMAFLKRDCNKFICTYFKVLK